MHGEIVVEVVVVAHFSFRRHYDGSCLHVTSNHSYRPLVLSPVQSPSFVATRLFSRNYPLDQKTLPPWLFSKHQWTSQSNQWDSDGRPPDFEHQWTNQWDSEVFCEASSSFPITTASTKAWLFLHIRNHRYMNIIKMLYH